MSLPQQPGGTADPYKEPDGSHLEMWLPPDQKFLDTWLAQSTELVDRYSPDFIYFDWWIGQPAFKPYLQQFAAYYYDRSAERNRQPVLTYKEEAMPANTATLDIERGKLDTLRLLPWQTDTSISIHSWGYVEERRVSHREFAHPATRRHRREEWQPAPQRGAEVRWNHSRTGTRGFAADG